MRLEDLATSNGPDLFVYLSANAFDGEEGVFDDDYVNLGRLQGNIGSQNYEIPAHVDPSRLRQRRHLVRPLQLCLRRCAARLDLALARVPEASQ